MYLKLAGSFALLSTAPSPWPKHTHGCSGVGGGGGSWLALPL